MQVMSAVCLVDTMPHLRQTLPSLREQSTLAITQGISRVRNLGLGPVTADLVFAVLAMGTSSHWITPGNSDYLWLESARELLFMWSVGISAADSLLHAYFCQALAYWEMLLALVGRGSNPSIIEKKRHKYQDKIRQAMFPEDGAFGTTSHLHSSTSLSFKPLGTLPNSWCGISNEVIETFGQILALCRSACDYNQDQRTVCLEIASKALCDIAIARELEKELLSMDFDALVLLDEQQGFQVHTRDENTPVSHLLETAEVYRKAGLLQLYLTFDDLAVNASGGQNGFANGCNDAKDEMSRETFLTDLTLQLLATLERIPAESGSKFIHPMLYISAAAGLKFQRYPDPQCPRTPEEVNNDPSDIFTSQLEWDLLDITSVVCLRGSSDTISVFIPQSVFKVAEARRLVLSRLDTIRQALPYKASDSFLRLVKTIWSEYDGAQSDTSAKHWLEMSRQIGLDMPL
ncbi:C6 zinc finger domain-containing protein [Fusarium circinatum]|uniref:C6 zinc finger domain-containing protein n=1 Tax=Fusarium circinatum TaxID=48490 RepID=A0A8H5WB78_FUSCI|nr:C6 zinc finger domain-containing protein [Fusarium circinatum]